VLKDNWLFFNNINTLSECVAKDILSVANYSIKETGKFIIVLLGMGEDGHTASLFPHRTYDKYKNIVIEKNSPKYPKNRISMSFQMFNKSNHVFKVINGTSKKNAVDLWLKNTDLPINKIYGDKEKVYVCLV